MNKAPKRLNRGNVEAFIKAHDAGLPWKIRHEHVGCACNTGDNGRRDTYNNGRYDVHYVEYPNARYRVDVVPLVDWPDGSPA